MPGKHKDNEKRIKPNIQLQVISILYLSFLSLVILTSQTSAYFKEANNVNTIINMGIWAIEEEEDQSEDWDGSDLTFQKDGQYEKVCEDENLSAIIINNGLDMKKPTEYEIYYSLLGTYADGEKIESGIIDPLLKNGSVTLSYASLELGYYYFEVFQNMGYPGEVKLRSEIFTIKCTDDIEPVEDEESERGKEQNIDFEDEQSEKITNSGGK